MSYGGKRPGSGRPRGVPTRPFPVRVAEDRITAYQEAAARAGMGLREWVETTLDKEATMVTDEQIEALRSEAGVAGDLAQVAVCDRALDGDEAARRECQRVIDEARANA